MRRLALAALVILAGCATTDADVARVIGADQPAEYRAGYKDGCPSGYVAAGHPYYRFAKDARRYTADALYKQGWDDGHASCKGGYESIGRAMR